MSALTILDRATAGFFTKPAPTVLPLPTYVPTCITDGRSSTDPAAVEKVIAWLEARGYRLPPVYWQIDGTGLEVDHRHHAVTCIDIGDRVSLDAATSVIVAAAVGNQRRYRTTLTHLPNATPIVAVSVTLQAAAGGVTTPMVCALAGVAAFQWLAGWLVPRRRDSREIALLVDLAMDGVIPRLSPKDHSDSGHAVAS